MAGVNDLYAIDSNSITEMMSPDITSDSINKDIEDCDSNIGQFF